MKKLVAIGISLLFLLLWFAQNASVPSSAKAELASSSDENLNPKRESQSSDVQPHSRSEVLPPSASQIQKLSSERQAFITKYPGNWVFHETKTGAIQSLMGGTLPGVALNSETALSFLREIAPLLGADPQNLRLTLIQPDGSARSQSFRVEQVIEGYKVYQGYATLIGNKKTGDGYIVNSSLRSVQYDGHKPLVTALQAEENLLSKFALEAGDAGLINPDPVLFEKTPGNSELAWVFTADLRGEPSGAHEVVVSAVTGEILYQESRLAN